MTGIALGDGRSLNFFPVMQHSDSRSTWSLHGDFGDGGSVRVRGLTDNPSYVIAEVYAPDGRGAEKLVGSVGLHLIGLRPSLPAADCDRLVHVINQGLPLIEQDELALDWSI